MASCGPGKWTLFTDSKQLLRHVSMAASIAEGKLAPANGQNPGIRTVEQLLFALSWCQKPAPKTGPQYCRKKERLPQWRPRFWDQGVAYTVSPPLRAVSSGDSGTFRLFFLAMGLTKPHPSFTVYIYIYIYYTFTYTFTYIYTYTHTYIYIHTHTHIYIYIYVSLFYSSILVVYVYMHV